MLPVRDSTSATEERGKRGGERAGEQRQGQAKGSVQGPDIDSGGLGGTLILPSSSLVVQHFLHFRERSLGPLNFLFSLSWFKCLQTLFGPETKNK